MAPHAEPKITRVARLALVVADLEASERFFAEAFDFVPDGCSDGDSAFAELMGVPEVRCIRSRLRLGEQVVELLAFTPAGKPYPSGSTSSDLWFQHFAIIVSDMGEAYARLQKAGRFTPISQGGPVTLPAGIEAFKFRDAEGHPLELLAFPKNGGPDHWKDRRGSQLFLGIDHSAVAVGATDVTKAFLEGCFGLTQSEQTHNVGPEQSRMDDVADANVIVTGLVPENPPPHVELLGYEVGSRRPIDPTTASNDIAATHFVLETGDLEPIVMALAAGNARYVSQGLVTLANGTRALMVQDPDGHRFVVEERT